MNPHINLVSDSERQILQQYNKYKTEISEINRKLTEIQYDKSETTNVQRINLFARRDALRTNIFKLIPFNHAAFERYAECMLHHARNIIMSSAFMSDCIMNWETIDVPTLRQFGTLLLSGLDKQYRESDTTVEFALESTSADNHGPAAGYDWNNNIYICTDKQNTKNPDDFIGILLHEYIHYLCIKHPGKSPLGKHFSRIAAQHYLTFYGGPKNQKEFEEYKNQPFERPAYQIQTYITTHEFTKTLRSDITILRIRIQQQHNNTP